MNKFFVRQTAAVLVAVLALEAMAFAVGSKDAEYVGGTIMQIKENTDGKMSAADPKALTFTSGKSTLLQVPYDKVVSLSYGQHAGRRVGMPLPSA